MAAGPDTLYAVLGVSPAAGNEELRRAYHAAALTLHPDRQVPSESASAPSPEAGGSGAGVSAPPLASAATGGPAGGASPDAAAAFVRLQAAWEVLRDGPARAAYDRSLADAREAAARADAVLVVGDEAALSSMKRDSTADGAAVYWHPCRCGDRYELPADEVPACRAEAEGDDGAPGGAGGPAGGGQADVAAANRRVNGGKGEGGEGREEAEPSELLVACGSCSLHLRVMVDTGPH